MSAALPEKIEQLETKLKSSNEVFNSIRLGEAIRDATNSYNLQFEGDELVEKILMDLFRQWMELEDFEGDLKPIIQEVIKEEAGQ